jgi:hypothetical protein
VGLLLRHYDRERLPNPRRRPAGQSLSDAELDDRIERYGDKAVCDGITVDTATSTSRT